MGRVGGNRLYCALALVPHTALTRPEPPILTLVLEVPAGTVPVTGRQACLPVLEPTSRIL